MVQSKVRERRESQALCDALMDLVYQIEVELDAREEPNEYRDVAEFIEDHVGWDIE